MMDFIWDTDLQSLKFKYLIVLVVNVERWIFSLLSTEIPDIINAKNLKTFRLEPMVDINKHIQY